MSEENVNTLKRGYQLFAEGNVPGVLELFDENIVWEEPDGSKVYPGTHKGHQGVVGGVFTKIPATYEEFAVVPNEYIAQGDRVVTLGEFRGKANGKQQNFMVPFAMVWTFKNGKAVKCEQYYDTASMNSAVE